MSKNQVKIISSHKVATQEPVYLIEMEVSDEISNFDFGKVTQAIHDQPIDNWQVAYDEQEIESPNGNKRVVFFFHYLNLDIPLSTSLGELDVPSPSPLPNHLKRIEYCAP